MVHESYCIISSLFIKAAGVVKQANVCAAFLLAAAGQRHSVQTNECMDHVYFSAQYIGTNVTVEIVYI
jgi:hypothetical protein